MSDFEIIQRRADSLRFVDVGLHVRWPIPDPDQLVERDTPWREIGWIGFDGSAVVIGLHPETGDEDAGFEEHWLDADTLLHTVALIPVEVTA